MKITKNNRCHYKQTQHGWQSKKVYTTFHEANIACKKTNICNAIDFKIIPYTCKFCGKIHIGKDKSVLNDLNSVILDKVEIFSLSY
jgi:hypothetical protein